MLRIYAPSRSIEPCVQQHVCTIYGAARLQCAVQPVVTHVSIKPVSTM
jgi:hypothetical protein